MSVTVLDIIITYRQALLAGLCVTLKIFCSVAALGIGIGVLIGVLRYRYRFWIDAPMRVLTFIFSGIPILVFLFWAHYPTQALLGVVIDPFYTSIFVLTVINTLAVSDLVTGNLLDFPEQYLLAAKVCGLSKREAVLKIQLPIVTRQLIPELLPAQVYMLQATLFASLISTDEIFRVAQRINSVEYKPVQIYSALAIFFVVVSLPLNGLAIYLRQRFTRNISER